jgi:hypothetical protein
MKRTIQAKLLILAVFVVGLLSGATLMDVYETRVFSSDQRGGRGASYVEYLQLTEEQETGVAVILEGTREGFRELRRQTRPLYEQLSENTQNEIRELLTEPQQALYSEWIEDLRQRRDRERGGRDRE